jgi:CspA family cold shock protein
MGQKGRDRSQRRRGFDDEEQSGPPAYGGRSRHPSPTDFRESAAPSGPAIDAIVKWFNAEKGFGFVELADGSGDAFLHAGVLEAAGRAAVDPDSKVSVQVGVGQKGRQVTAVLAVEASSRPPRARTRGPLAKGSSHREGHDPGTAIGIEGTVKWFNADKGFGFVACEDGEKDVFLHASIVERAGLRGLAEGQRIAMKVVKTQKGREAISFTLIDN